MRQKDKSATEITFGVKVMNVWVLTAESYDKYEVLGVFATLKKAKDYKKSIFDEYEDHELNIVEKKLNYPYYSRLVF